MWLQTQNQMFLERTEDRWTELLFFLLQDVFPSNSLCLIKAKQMFVKVCLPFVSLGRLQVGEDMLSGLGSYVFKENPVRIGS